jgi:hypothetical protein
MMVVMGFRDELRHARSFSGGRRWLQPPCICTVNRSVSGVVGLQCLLLSRVNTRVNQVFTRSSS